MTDQMHDGDEQWERNALGATATRTFRESGDDQAVSAGYRSALSDFDLDDAPVGGHTADAPEPPAVAAVVSTPRPAPARAEVKPGAFAWLGRLLRRLLG